MNTPNIPGFTADASLRRTSERSGPAVRSTDTPGGGSVIPQLRKADPDLWCECDVNDGISLGGCRCWKRI